MEMLALQHLRQRELRHQLHHVVVAQLIQPLGVVPNLGLLAIQNLEHLLLVRLRIRRNLLACQRLPRHIAPRRIADQRRPIPNQKDDGMPEILKVLQLPQQHRVPKMQIRRRRIEPCLDPHRLTRRNRLCNALLQRLQRNNLRSTLRNQIKLVFNGWKRHVIHKYIDSRSPATQPPATAPTTHRDAPGAAATQPSRPATHFASESRWYG